MNELPVLFKRNSNGSVNRWRIWVDDSGDCPVIMTEYGLEGGSLQTSEVKVKAGKNLGRANATTPLQQALSERDAKHLKQQDKGYRATLEAIDAAKVRMPMLADKFSERMDEVVYPCVVQYKLDGARCIAHKEGGVVTLTSRGNKPMDKIGHINEALVGIMEDGETWDGEVYAHEVDFQDQMSRLKRAQEGTSSIRYHVYDVVAPGEYLDRFMPIKGRLDVANNPDVVALGHQYAQSEDDIKRLLDEAEAAGYEGIMIRHDGCPYKAGGRSPHLLKCKSFLDEDFEIVDVKDGKGRFEGLAIFVLKTDQGAIFDCTPRGDTARRQAYFRDRDTLIGKKLTARFFEWNTSNPPKPRHAVGVGIKYEND